MLAFILAWAIGCGCIENTIGYANLRNEYPQGVVYYESEEFHYTITPVWEEDSNMFSYHLWYVWEEEHYDEEKGGYTGEWYVDEGCYPPEVVELYYELKAQKAETPYVSQEYLSELAYNSQTNEWP